MPEIQNIILPLDAGIDELRKIAAKKASIPLSSVRTFTILKESIDARKKSDIKKVYSVLISEKIEKREPFSVPYAGESEYRPIVVGFGPAGIFASYALSLAGLRPIVLERGLPISERIRGVNALWQNGKLDPRANAEFGEGGAGAFSDGKLNSGIKEKELTAFVLDTFVSCGAPEEIAYLAKPHIGTDRLRDAVVTLRHKIEDLGGEIRFGACVSDVSEKNGVLRVLTESDAYKTDRLILAVGHSARDTYEMLLARGFSMEAKPFSVGVRIEQLQEEIDLAMFGRKKDPLLPPADYKIWEHTKAGGAYSFCMCPGGFVVCASSEEGGVVTNGMSYHARDGKNANAALLVGVDEKDFGSEILSGVRYQRELERKAFLAAGGNYKAPCQRVGDFIKKQKGGLDGAVRPTYAPGVTPCDLNGVLPPRISEALRLALPSFDKKIKGFSKADNLLTGVETRSSSPVRVLRGEDFMSLSHKGVYPCGEGCGYAGGIMSAAVDGLKVALSIINEVNDKKRSRS